MMSYIALLLLRGIVIVLVLIYVVCFQFFEPSNLSYLEYLIQIIND